VHVITADKYKRVHLPGIKPNQVFAFASAGDGSITLTPVKADAKPRFPKGSLTKYFTGDLGRERDKLETTIASGCLQGPPE
jgi:hypothetical protein